MNQPNNHPLILAIDTSCDETAVAVTQGSMVLSNIIASQVELHKPYGGVFPTVAKQAHVENLPAAIELALRRAQVKWEHIETIAVTQGPGLAPALEVGLVSAQELGRKWRKPVIGVNHLEGHLVSVLAQPTSHHATQKTNSSRALEAMPFDFEKFEKPVLGLIISGGHTEMLSIPTIGTYTKLGGTIDDAAGEVLDKVGRMLDLGYPAGPVIEKFALLGNAKAFTFPLPMTTSGDYNLSFSGLKTFARNKIEALKAENTLTKHDIYDFAASFQYAVFRSICYKLNKLLQKQEFSEVWLGGGVAANTELRRQLRATLKPFGLKLRVPYTKKLCGDNAVMIGLAAHFALARNPSLWNLDTTDETSRLDRKPRWKLTV